MPKVRPRKSKVYHNGRPFSDYESYSSISKWLKCPVIFAAQYFQHEREPSTLPLAFGNAFHGLVEDSLIHKQLSGDAMGLGAAKSRWEQRWLIELFTAKQAKAGLRIDDTSPEQFFQQGLACTEIWVKEHLPNIEPRDVEIDFMLSLRDINRKLYGRLDFTETNGTLVDVKTSGRAYSSAVSDYELQFAIYHVGYFDLYHQWPKKAEILRVETSRNADIERVDISLSRERVQELFDNTVRPAMIEICEAWDSGLFECRCSVKHETLNFFEEEEKARVKREADEAAAAPILDPEKFAKAKMEKNITDAFAELKKPSDIDPDTIPF